ncbi:MAG: winged helix-turn-helix domain-containing protein, partial [Anaerolineae bacterium]
PAALQAAAFCLFHGQNHGVGRATLARGVAAAAREALSPAGPRPRAEERGAQSGDGRGGDGVVVDRASGEVYVDGRRVEALTALEYNLLDCLAASPGRLRTKAEIVREVWGEELADDSRVEKLISRLRRKVEPVPGRPQYIRTVRGRGYRLVVPG